MYPPCVLFPRIVTGIVFGGEKGAKRRGKNETTVDLFSFVSREVSTVKSNFLLVTLSGKI